MAYRRAHAGFTLIEMSVVLVGIAMITAMGVSAGIDVVESTKRVSTEKKLDAIEEALLIFRKQYNRLPCPGSLTLATDDASYGIEAATPGACTGGVPSANFATAESLVPSGAVPVRTLGLPDEFIYDGWGRKFQYEVAPEITSINSFLYSQTSDACAIEIVDASGNVMPQAPLYDLISFGKDGLGGYNKNGTMMSGTAVGEQAMNVRSISNTPMVRFKGRPTGKMGEADYYDDIVRFKSRYQMIDENDRTTPAYSGPEMIVAYDTGAGEQLVYAKKTCGTYVNAPGTFPAAASYTPKFVSFTNNNNNLFVYQTDGVTGGCHLYTINGDTVEPVSEETPVPNCPAGATMGAMAHASNTLVLNDTSAPFARVYRMRHSMSLADYAEFSNALKPELASIPDHLSISQDGTYLAVSKANTYKNLYLYTGRSDGSYRAFTSDVQPDTALTVYTNAVSPDGKYYAAAVVAGGGTRIYLWRIMGNTFAPVWESSWLTGILYTAAGMTAPTIFEFSRNSDFILLGGTSSGANLVVLSINAQSETLSAVASLTLSPAPVAAAFSKDASLVAVATGVSGDDSLKVYRRNGDTYNEDPLSPNLELNESAPSSFIAMSQEYVWSKSCDLPWGGKIANGDSVKTYQVGSGASDACSESEVRNCTNGELSGSYTFESCTITSCSLPWGGTINIGDSVTAYEESSPYDDCANHSETRTCSADGLSGSYGNESCGKQCITPWGVAINHGESANAYPNYITHPCTPEVRTCNDGVLSGTAQHQACASSNNNLCVTSWGVAIAAGSYAEGYSSASPPSGMPCPKPFRSTLNSSTSSRPINDPADFFLISNCGNGTQVFRDKFMINGVTYYHSRGSCSDNSNGNPPNYPNGGTCGDGGYVTPTSPTCTP